ncbi:DNA polymerase III subunit alpha [Patescibacteria group bacterium]
MFCHLHCHSHYSLLDGMPKIPELVSRAKELGMTSLALTDHGVTYGLIEFYKECKKNDIKPILGVEAYVAPRGHKDKESGVDIKPYHLVLLAKNEEGYKNLLRLTSIAHLDGHYYKPRVDKELLKKYGKGLIGLSACLAGEVARALLSDNLETAERATYEYNEIFGKGNFYLELQPQTSKKNKDQETMNKRMAELAKKTGTPLVVTKDVHYISPDDKEAQDALLCIQMGTTLDNTERMTMMDIDCSFSSEEEMRAWFPDLPEAIENTEKIANECNLELNLGTDILPSFKTPNGESDSDYLRKLCEKGLEYRYGEVTDEIKKRLEWELETIDKMGYASYFLIVQDFIGYAKREGIVVGPGRGSAAGSIVSYSLGVTDLDPLHYKLLFERFLNPDRISMPDIDMDFADIKRYKVIDYVMEKYGKDRVAGIITFGTMMARAVIRDVGRVLGVAYGDVDKIAKMIPPPVQGRHTPLSQHIEESPELTKLYNDDEEIKRLMDLAVKLEGTVRHASQHACAVVIADASLTEYTALQQAQGGDVETVTQYSMGPIEDVGLLKMDFLGLANLSIIQDTIEIVEAVERAEKNGRTEELKNGRTEELKNRRTEELKNGRTEELKNGRTEEQKHENTKTQKHESTGEEERPTLIDIEKIPLDDKKTFELLARAETTGVFQLESAGMKRYIKELKPTELEDIIAMVALYRPGPMQFIESFINRKHGREKIEYMHPSMENALKNTYGIPVYQEQVMQVAKDMAGFTGGEADTLRKAMGKKIAKLMAQMKIKFIDGAVKNGVEKKLAVAIFQKLEDFAAYGFNRSHAACYAMISYRTAYLKANWPNSFMAALLNSDSGNMDRTTIEVEECKHIGLEVLPPDINESFPRFAVVPKTNKIRFGLEAIKNVGSDIVEAVIAERKKNGKFDSLEDFLERVQHKNLNKKSLEAFVKCGAMDSLGKRGEMLENMPKMLDFNREIREVQETAHNSLFGAGGIDLSRPTLKMEPAEPVDKKMRLTWEKELLGLYVSAHPFTDALPLVRDLITPSDELPEKKDGNWVNVSGVISIIKKKKTRKGEMNPFVTIQDLKGSFELLVFPTVLEKTRELWQEDKIVIVGGRLSFKEGETKVLANKVELVDVDNMEKIREVFSGSHRNSDFGSPKSDNTPFSTIGGRASDSRSSNTNDNIPPKRTIGFPKPDSTTIGHPVSDSVKKVFDGRNVGNAVLKEDGLYVSVPQKMKKQEVDEMKAEFQKHPGETRVFLEIAGNPAKIVKTNYLVDERRFI